MYKDIDGYATEAGGLSKADIDSHIATYKPEPEAGVRTLSGASLADYVSRPINEQNTLLGNRYLCRGGGMFIVAPSGIGKSVVSVQAAIEWAVGRDSFGIHPARPLKTLIIQAEGDVIEMSQICRHLELTDTEMETQRENVWMEPLNDLTGLGFLAVVDGFLEQFPADLLIINPYTSYVGCEVKDDELSNAFLRNTLNPILTKRCCAAIIVHHTPKTNFRDTTNWRPSDWMYSGSGASCLTNWARAYLVIDPTEVPGVYKFIAAKCGQRIGWGDRFPIFETYWSHSKEGGKLLWSAATDDEVAATAKTKRNLKPAYWRLSRSLTRSAETRFANWQKKSGISDKRRLIASSLNSPRHNQFLPKMEIEMVLIALIVPARLTSSFPYEHGTVVIVAPQATLFSKLGDCLRLPASRFSHLLSQVLHCAVGLKLALS
jgi:hypothetical protein